MMTGQYVTTGHVQVAEHVSKAARKRFLELEAIPQKHE